MGTALVGYASPNTGQAENQSPSDQAALAERERIREISERDSAAHKAMSLAILNDCDIHVGIALEIPDPVGDSSDEIGYWEVI
jgi:hypothetical protein